MKAFLLLSLLSLASTVEAADRLLCLSSTSGTNVVATFPSDAFEAYRIPRIYLFLGENISFQLKDVQLTQGNPSNLNFWGIGAGDNSEQEFLVRGTSRIGERKARLTPVAQLEKLFIPDLRIQRDPFHGESITNRRVGWRPGQPLVVVSGKGKILLFDAQSGAQLGSLSSTDLLYNPRPDDGWVVFDRVDSSNKQVSLAMMNLQARETINVPVSAGFSATAARFVRGSLLWSESNSTQVLLKKATLDQLRKGQARLVLKQDSKNLGSEALITDDGDFVLRQEIFESRSGRVGGSPDRILTKGSLRFVRWSDGETVSQVQEAPYDSRLLQLNPIGFTLKNGVALSDGSLFFGSDRAGGVIFDTKTSLWSFPATNDISVCKVMSWAPEGN